MKLLHNPHYRIPVVRSLVELSGLNFGKLQPQEANQIKEKIFMMWMQFIRTWNQILPCEISLTIEREKLRVSATKLVYFETICQ